MRGTQKTQAAQIRVADAETSGTVLWTVHGICPDRVDPKRDDNFGGRSGRIISIYDQPLAGRFFERFIKRSDVNVQRKLIYNSIDLYVSFYKTEKM